MTLRSKPFPTKNRCMRILRTRTSTNTTLLRPWKLRAKAKQREIVRLVANPTSASQSRTPPLRKILASTIPRRNTLVRIAATIEADKISAATVVVIAVAEDAGAGAVDAVAADAHKEAVIFLLQSMRPHNLHKGISARTIPAVATTRTVSKAAVSNRATIAARKARVSVRLRLRRVPGKTISCCRAN